MTDIEIIIDNEVLEIPKGVQVPITFQVNNPENIDTFQNDYSITFDVDDTPKNRKILGFAANNFIETDTRYKFIDCIVKQRGAIIFLNAKLKVNRILKKMGIAKIELQLFSGNINLFDFIGQRTLQDLDMSAYDHEMMAGQNLQTVS